MSIASNIKRVLYRNLSLENYLRTVSRLFFAGYRLGARGVAYEYPRFLKNLVRPGDTVIDIGANLGYYSRILSELVGNEGWVYAIEPVEPVVNVLCRNLFKRGLPNVEVMPYALGAENRTISMVNDSSRYTGYMGTGQNRISEDDVEGGDMRFEVEMRRGSELFPDLERLDFIKCDIEGYEGVVIPEMASVIQKHLPVVLLETGGAMRRRMIELFREWGYAGYVLVDGKLVSVMHGPEKDIVFVPGHRHDLITR